MHSRLLHLHKSCWFCFPDPVFAKIQLLTKGENKKNSLLQLFDTHTAQPGSFGQDCSAVVTHMVIAHLTLAGGKTQSTQRLLASATTVRAVSSTATFGPFPLHIQQFRLQLPETKKH